MGSGRVPTCFGLVAVLAVLTVAPQAFAQPLGRLTGLDNPYAGSSDPGLPTMSPIPPGTSLQPQRDPGGMPYEPDFVSPNGEVIPVPQSKALQVRLGQRYGVSGDSNIKINIESKALPNNTTRWLLTGGIVINVVSADGKDTTEFAADDVVIWRRGAKAHENVQDGFDTDPEGKDQTEIYMAGNVIIRSTRGKLLKQPLSQTLRAEEVYYDVERTRAIALRADLELSVSKLPDAFHLKGEVRRLDLENYEILNGTASASKLPSDPGLRLDSERYLLSQRKTVRRNIFGIPFRDVLTGEKVEIQEQLVTGRNVVTRLDGIPVFYTPVMRMNAEDPLGPLQSLGFGTARQFGFSVYTSWDLYELLALKAPQGHTWRLNVDDMTQRGIASGFDYMYSLPGIAPGDPNRGNGVMTLYGLQDRGADLLGGDRGPEPTQPSDRGRFLWRHQQSLDVIEGLYFQGQVALLSDKNFLEQYYKNEFDLGPNQETFLYAAWQHRNFEVTGLVEDRFARQWVTETNRLPDVHADLIGQTFLDDLFVYNMRSSGTYAQLMPTKDPPFALLPTQQRDSTGRVDLWQELNVPLALGPVKFAPYAILDLTDYTNDLDGNNLGRVYGAGGARASVPFSRLYEDVSSELLNMRGLYHKITFGADYRYARTNVHYNQLPLLDQLNDDATDQAWRNITPQQSQYVAGPTGLALQNAPGYSVYNPQLYAIRRVLEDNIDTEDDINVLQASVSQRFQTKRGYPGMEHTVDVLAFDVSASYFPQANRDNFGHSLSFLEYAGTWNLGDRTALVSSGWFEPYEGGSRYWNAGVYVNRTDRTNLYLGYRQTDPLSSKAVTASVGYQLSRRYYLTTNMSYDFGIQAALSNSLTLTRVGTDLTISIGFSYTAFVNSFGFQFNIVPNLATALGGKYASGIGSQALPSR